MRSTFEERVFHETNVFLKQNEDAGTQAQSQTKQNYIYIYIYIYVVSYIFLICSYWCSLNNTVNSMSWDLFVNGCPWAQMPQGHP